MKNKKKIVLKEGQELVTVKKVKFIKSRSKGSNNTNPMINEEMIEWLINDPDPEKTLNTIKKQEKKKKALSKDKPVKLMKQELTEEEYINFWKDLADLRAYYAIEYTRKKKKIKQSDLAHTYYLPQCVYNYNVKYWKKLITDKRFLEHPEFMVVNPEDIEEDKPLKK